MALYYFTQKHIVKSTQSAVAAAAYRSGDKLYSERDMETKSYRSREVKPESFIMAPDHAPNWVYDREKLWNEVEKVEQRKQSRLAKELIIALPIELSEKEQSELLKKFVYENCVLRGMVADVAIHRDKIHNPHAHVMLTVRPFEKDGSWGFKKKRVPKVVDGKIQYKENGKPVTVSVPVNDWYDKKTMLNWRDTFAELVNEKYKEKGLSERVSSKSYAEQGLDKKPKKRLTWQEYKLERDAKQHAEQAGIKYKPITEKGKLNQEINNFNKIQEAISTKEKLLSDYRIKFSNELLNELNMVRKKLHFDDKDWKSIKLVARRVGGFVDFEKSLDNAKLVTKWNEKLERDYRELKTEMNVLSAAKNDFEKSAKKVFLYGFNPGTFEADYNQKMSELNDKAVSLSKKLEKAYHLKDQSLHVLKLQKTIAKAEFEFLYNSSNVAEKNHFLLAANKMVSDFRLTGKLESDSEFQKQFDLLKEEFLNKEIRESLSKYKAITGDLYITNRLLENRKRDYSNALKEKRFDQVYDHHLKYKQSMDKISHLESVKSNLDQTFGEHIRSIYTSTNQEGLQSLQSMNIAEKRRLLILHLDGHLSGSLEKDIQLSKDFERQLREGNKPERPFKKNMHDSGLVHVGPDEKKQDDLEKQRKKNKKKAMARGSRHMD